MVNKIFCELSPKEKKELKRKLKIIGISRKTASNYSKGFWAIPKEIKDKLKEIEKNE